MHERAATLACVQEPNVSSLTCLGKSSTRPQDNIDLAVHFKYIHKTCSAPRMLYQIHLLATPLCKQSECIYH